MRLRLIRNATLRVEFASHTLLVDPSFDPALAWDPIEGIAHDGRNPLVELPDPTEEIVTGLDGVLVSHLHEDHWDPTARRLLPAASSCGPRRSPRCGSSATASGVPSWLRSSTVTGPT